VGAALPTGTVTFLFTDIEGSTRLVERLGTATWTDLLEAHQAIIRAALASATGVEVKTEGDSFFAVFASAETAVAAAAAMQRALFAYAWPTDSPVRVRMGLHTGEGVVAPDSDYVGLDVHRAARVASAAHGGQVVLSDTTRALVAGALPEGTTLLDLGEHRLKDLSRAERISQLVISGVPEDFPPLRTLDATPNNLPIVLTDFIGREAVLAEAHRLLDGTRLLTLTGPGGTGKTRLSLQLAADVAERFPDGLYFVALEPISDPALVPSAIATVLGVQDMSGTALDERLRDFLKGRKVLLVLDNMEQVTGAAPFLGDLLRAAPGVTCIVTSRAALHVYGEQEFPVPTLGVPDLVHLPPLDELAQVDGVALFLARARTARPDFRLTPENAPAVARLVATLDGLPLALELAAARVKVLSPEGILERLQGRLDLLGGGARDLPARQQTLRGAIAWSYDLLEPPAKRLFSGIAVFVGGFDLVAAEAVCGPATGQGQAPLDVLDGLSSLVDQSLLRQELQGDHPRFVMLETIRAYATERLAAEVQAGELRRRHAEYFAAMAEEAMPHLTGGERARWLDRVQRDHDNLRAAIGFAVEQGDAHLAMRLLYALWRFWQSRAYLQEGAARATAVLAIPTDEQGTELRARALEAAGGLAYWRGQHADAGVYYDAALAIARSLGDQHLIADAVYNAAFLRTILTSEPDRVNDGVVMLQEAIDLYRATGDASGVANAMWGIGTAQYFREDWPAAYETFTASHETLKSIDDSFMMGWVLHMLGSTEVRLGKLGPAEEHIREDLLSMQAAGETTGIVMIIDDFADLAAARQLIPRALRLIGAARALEDATDARLAATTQELMRRERYRDVLAADEAERCLAEGRAMDMAQAVAYALSGDDDVVTAPDRLPEPASAD
jgi:predicted ATPase/class 3 adenylate cyclase